MLSCAAQIECLQTILQSEIWQNKRDVRTAARYENC